MNLVKQLRTWDEVPEDDSDAFHWLDLKTAEAADLIERQAAQIEMMREVLAYVKDACLYSDDDGAIGVTQEPHIDSLAFDDICKALAIQPDDSALKAWLGEPVGEVKKHTGSLKDMAIIVWTGKQPEEGTNLYSPKGLK